MTKKAGFTLIELVMVIVILGILAAMVIPRFVNLQDEAKKSASRGALGAIRAAIAVKYASNAAYGVTANNYIPASIEASMFQDSQVPVEPVSNASTVLDGSPNGNGGWAYDSTSGKVWVNNSTYSVW